MLLGGWSWWPFGDDALWSAPRGGAGPYAAVSKVLKSTDLPNWPFTVKEVTVIASADCSAYVFSKGALYILNDQARVGDSVVINDQRFEARELDEPGSIWAYEEPADVGGGPKLRRGDVKAVTRVALSLIKACG